MGHIEKNFKVKISKRLWTSLISIRVKLISAKEVLWLANIIKALIQNFVGKKLRMEMREMDRYVKHTMTCNPQKTTKTARVWNNAIRRPAYDHERQSMSLYPSPIFKFLRTRSPSKCFV